jgi:hypothetical protein
VSGYIKIKVGDYEHSVANRNAAWFSWHEAVEMSRAHRRAVRHVRVTLTTVILRDTQAELTAELEALRAAHVDGKDVVVLDNDGGETIHVLRDSQTINGIRARMREYPGGLAGVSGPGIEYVVRRVVRTTFSAELLDSDDGLVYFRQSVRQIGTGGPAFVIREGFFRPPIRQDTKLATKYAMVQEGFAIGLEDYPLFPAYLWPGSLKEDGWNHVMEYISPERLGKRKNLEFGIRWRYYYEAAGFLLFVKPPIILG